MYNISLLYNNCVITSNRLSKPCLLDHLQHSLCPSRQHPTSHSLHSNCWSLWAPTLAPAAPVQQAVSLSSVKFIMTSFDNHQCSSNQTYGYRWVFLRYIDMFWLQLPGHLMLLWCVFAADCLCNISWCDTSQQHQVTLLRKTPDAVKTCHAKAKIVIHMSH